MHAATDELRYPLNFYYRSVCLIEFLIIDTFIMGASSASRYNFKWRRFFTFVDFICESSYEDTKLKTKSSNAIVNLQGHTYISMYVEMDLILC